MVTKAPQCVNIALTVKGPSGHIYQKPEEHDHRKDWVSVATQVYRERTEQAGTVLDVYPSSNYAAVRLDGYVNEPAHIPSLISDESVRARKKTAGRWSCNSPVHDSRR